MADPATPFFGDTSVGQVPMERLRTIFDGMFDGVWLVGSDGRTTYANEAVAGMLSTTPASARDIHGPSHPRRRRKRSAPRLHERLSGQVQPTADGGAAPALIGVAQGPIAAAAPGAWWIVAIGGCALVVSALGLFALVRRRPRGD